MKHRFVLSRFLSLRSHRILRYAACLGFAAGALGTTSASAQYECVRSLALSKSAVPKNLTTVTLNATLRTCTGTLSDCSGQPATKPCPHPATITGGTINLTMTCSSAPTITVPPIEVGIIGSGSRVTTYHVDVTVLAGKTYAVSGVANVNFTSDDSSPAQTLQNSGDAYVTAVEPASPGSHLPLVEIVPLEGADRTAKPGEQIPMRFRVTNNGAQALKWNACLSSAQSAKRPKKILGHCDLNTFAFSDSIWGRPFGVQLFVGDGRPKILSQFKACVKNQALPAGQATIVNGYTTIPSKAMGGASSEYRFQLWGKFDDGKKIDASISTTVLAERTPPKGRGHWFWPWAK